MVELVTAFAQLVASIVQVVGDVCVAIIASIFRAIFAKQTIDSEGKSIGEPMTRPANRWQIFGYSLLGTTIIAVCVGGFCFYVWESFSAALIGAGITSFLGIGGALCAAIE